MEKAFMKEQLVDGIHIIDKFLKDSEPIFSEMEELVKDGCPDDFREEWELCIIERRSMKNIRALFANDLLVNHGIMV